MGRINNYIPLKNPLVSGFRNFSLVTYRESACHETLTPET
jgi:hypothetical protein